MLRCGGQADRSSMKRAGLVRYVSRYNTSELQTALEDAHDLYQSCKEKPCKLPEVPAPAKAPPRTRHTHTHTLTRTRTHTHTNARSGSSQCPCAHTYGTFHTRSAPAACVEQCYARWCVTSASRLCDATGVLAPCLALRAVIMPPR